MSSQTQAGSLLQKEPTSEAISRIPAKAYNPSSIKTVPANFNRAEVVIKLFEAGQRLWVTSTKKKVGLKKKPLKNLIFQRF